MPARKLMKKKRTMKRKLTRYKRKPITYRKPLTYGFSRTFEHMVNLADATTYPANFIEAEDNMVVGTITNFLSELPNHEEFAALFAQYKLNFAVITIVPANRINIAPQTPDLAANIIMSTWNNRHGTLIPASTTIDDLNQIQQKRDRIMPNRPFSLKMSLTQLTKVFSGVGSGTEDYVVQRSKYISTNEPNTPHYGYNMAFRRADGLAFSQYDCKFLMKIKVYLTTRQVI